MMSPSIDFIDIGDVMNHQFLRGSIISLDENTDTGAVMIDGSTFSALLMFH
jgi:hypothetical protein